MVQRASAAALSKTRQNLSHAVFTDLTRHLLALVEQHIGMPRWHVGTLARWHVGIDYVLRPPTRAMCG
ncbi:hypothetical protein LMG28690_05425 [Paraburkholderia caffeinilytica]|nr:hypothetical protein LMG28690_05425 [Paraburkholderia caffeinilytica]